MLRPTTGDCICSDQLPRRRRWWISGLRCKGATSTLRFGVLSWNCTKFEGRVPDVAVVEENLSKFEKLLNIYDAQLAKTKYLAGDFYSMADLAHIPLLHRFVASSGKESLVTSRKHVNAWYETITSRPAWKKIVEQYPDV
ncbi:protein MpGST31 [Marchantia polymorpha subsp. ruderalis]